MLDNDLPVLRYSKTDEIPQSLSNESSEILSRRIEARISGFTAGFPLPHRDEDFADILLFAFRQTKQDFRKKFNTAVAGVLENQLRRIVMPMSGQSFSSQDREVLERLFFLIGSTGNRESLSVLQDLLPPAKTFDSGLAQRMKETIASLSREGDGDLELWFLEMIDDPQVALIALRGLFNINSHVAAAVMPRVTSVLLKKAEEAEERENASAMEVVSSSLARTLMLLLPALNENEQASFLKEAARFLVHFSPRVPTCLLMAVEKTPGVYSKALASAWSIDVTAAIYLELAEAFLEDLNRGHQNETEIVEHLRQRVNNLIELRPQAIKDSQMLAKTLGNLAQQLFVRAKETQDNPVLKSKLNEIAISCSQRVQGEERQDSYFRNLEMQAYIVQNSLESANRLFRTMVADGVADDWTIELGKSIGLSSSESVQRQRESLSDTKQKEIKALHTFDHRTLGGPALVTMLDSLVLSWTSAEPPHKLNVLPLGYDTEYRGLYDKPISLSQTSTDGPAVAFGDGRLFLAWTAADLRNSLGLMYSYDGKQFTQPIILDETSPLGPALVFGNSRLFLAWIGRDSRYFVNVACLLAASLEDRQKVSFKHKITLPVSSFASPALSFSDNKLYLSWTKDDASQNINILELSENLKPLSYIEMKETSDGRPALAKHGSLVLAWQDTAAEHRVSFCFSDSDIQHLGHKATDPKNKSHAGVTLTGLNEQLYIAWSGREPEYRLNIGIAHEIAIERPDIAAVV